METELKTIHDGSNSFYKKAKVITEDDKIILISYYTEVAYIKDCKAYVNGLYSQTTTRHIKEFLIQHGFKVESSKQIIEDYGK